VLYPTRAEIEQDPAKLGLTGRELAWMASKLDAFLVQVQGSARLDPVDGGPPLYIDYAASNGREYTSIGQLLVADGKIERSRLNIPAIRDYFTAHPEELDSYLNRNDRYIFFREGSSDRWPVGALGVEVTPLRTLATDKAIFPRGCVVLAKTKLVDAKGKYRPFEQFMLDQDAGGGIRSPGRADIYAGIGGEAGEIAGRQAHKGRLYYFLLKPERVEGWIRKPGPPGKQGKAARAPRKVAM
jgi:membrane-bound lytic murein transglycosylase A